LAVSKDAEKFASAAYAAVGNKTDMKIKSMINLPILITNPQTLVLEESCFAMYIILSVLFFIYIIYISYYKYIKLRRQIEQCP